MLDKILKDLQSQYWVKLLLHDAEVYIVGGCVRDAMMNKPIKDVDMVVDGISLDAVKNLLTPFGKVDIVGESFSVIKFRPTGHTGEPYDIAVPREDRKTGVGHKGFDVVTDGMTIKDDLKRRDFTINSIAVDVRTGKKLDPFMGTKDLAAKILRATNSAAFVEDPLRIVRAIQFAARFKFRIAVPTLKLMRQNAHLIKEITGERIKGELDKILLKHGSTKTAFQLLYDSDLDKALFGKKFISDDFDSFENLDMVSFYYVLGTLGNTEAWKFYKDRLKGEYVIIKALMTLENQFEGLNNSVDEEDFRWNVFQMLKTSPMLKNAKILSKRVKDIINKMKAGDIPEKIGDIPVNGYDIMEEFSVSGSEVGDIINKMYQDALMNKFDWKSKIKTLKYLENESRKSV